MNSRKRIILMLLLLMPALQAIVAQAKVEITLNNKHFTYQTPPTLVEALAPVGLAQNWYWPASKLFRLPAESIEQERAQILTQLERLKSGLAAEQQADIIALQYVIGQWQLAERILLPIDYDRARIEPTFNRRFDPGNYILQLERRPSTVTFWGAVKTSVSLNHQGASAVADYMPGVRISDLAERSWVWLVQPDGRVERVGVAAWNYQHIEAMPGALIYVPFSFTFFNDDLQRLNQRLVALSLHRTDK